MLKNILSILFATLLLTGCKQKTFSKIYNHEAIGSKISTVILIHKNREIKKLSEFILKNHNFSLKEKSRYTLQTNFSLYPKKCNNPLATDEQKNYIGFVQLTLFKDQKRIYLCQSDFREKSEISDTFENLIETMVDEMELTVN